MNTPNIRIYQLGPKRGPAFNLIYSVRTNGTLSLKNSLNDGT